MAAQKQEKQQ